MISHAGLYNYRNSKEKQEGNRNRATRLTPGLWQPVVRVKLNSDNEQTSVLIRNKRKADQTTTKPNILSYVQQKLGLEILYNVFEIIVAAIIK